MCPNVSRPADAGVGRVAPASGRPSRERGTTGTAGSPVDLTWNHGEAWSLADTVLVDDVGFLLVKASTAFARRTARILHEQGMRVRVYSALAIAAGPVAPTQREVAEGLSLDPSQIVPLVDELESLGLVERVPDPRDRRSKLVRATEAGRARFVELTGLLRADQRLMLADLPSAERAVVVDALRRFALTEDGTD